MHVFAVDEGLHMSSAAMNAGSCFSWGQVSTACSYV